MMEVLHRGALDERLAEQRSGSTGTGPPKPMPDIEMLPAPWPRRAKLAAAALGVLAVAGAAGTAVQMFDGNDVDVSGYESQIQDLTDQRTGLLAQNGDLTDAVTRLEADNARLGVDLQASRADVDAAAADLADARLDNTALTDDLADASTRIDDLLVTIGDLEAANTTVTAERDALVAMFPMLVDTSLVGVDVTGTYAARWHPAYNSGLADLAVPNVAQIVISRTAEGWLRVGIPGIVTADMTRTDGALFTMIDTDTAVPPVDGVARSARVAITVYAGETETGRDGTTTVTELGLSLAISTPALGSAPEGVALYGADLIPQG